MTQKMNMRVSQPQRPRARARWTRRCDATPTRHLLARVRYHHDVANDDSGEDGDFCASGDATKWTRVRVEAIDDDDDDDAPQVRTHPQL